MGKSDKKIRADSINHLRKRYDAFLEEDRKRKERNEDILTKLDKMRSSVTRYKANIYLDPRLPINIFGDAPKNPVRRYNETPMSTELDVRTKHTDETHLLSQISKKYILIPKLRSIDNDYVPRAIQQDNNNDNDWKSKYSILDKLKQNEKEEAINASAFNDSKLKNYDNVSPGLPKYREDDEPVKLSAKRDNMEGMKKDSVVDDYTPPQPSHPQNKGAVTFNDFNVDAPKDILEETEKLPKKSALTNVREPNILKAEPEITKMNEYVDNDFRGGINKIDQQQPKSEVSFAAPEVPTPVQNFQAVDARDQIEPVPYIAEQQKHFDETTDKHETEDSEKSYPVEEDISHVAAFNPEQSYPGAGGVDISNAGALYPEKSYPGDEDISHVEVLHPDELVQQITNENSNTELAHSQEPNYPIDVINVQEFTPGSNVTLVDGVNINPEGHNVEQYIPPSHQYAPENTAVEQEKDVAYQDPVNVYPEEQIPNEGNYDPSQQYETTENANHEDITSGIQEFETEQNEMYYSEQGNAQNYDQYNQGDGVYNADYTGPVEGYDQSAYYEGTQQQGAYPVEINEHEETSQRYDPNYEQQYATDAEQNQYAEQPQSQQENLELQEPTGDAEALEYDQEQYGAEQQQIAEHVEQQLDMEDGYVQQNLGGTLGDAVDESLLYAQAALDPTLEQNLDGQVIPAV